MDKKKPFILHEVIAQLIFEGIEISISTDFAVNTEIQYDTNIGAKSHLYLYVMEDGRLEARRRYDRVDTVRDFDHLMLLALDCMHGRKFITHSWAKLFEKHFGENWHDL